MTAKRSGGARIVVIVLAAVFLVPLGVAGTSIALPVIAHELGSDLVGLQWAVNGFNVAFALATIAAGVSADRFEHRLTFVIGLVVTFAASVSSALAPTLPVLDVGRALAGVGGGAVVAGGGAILTDAFPSGPPRASAFALFGTIIGLGLALGPSISGGVIAGVGWRGVYAVVAVFVLVILSVSFLLPRSPRPRVAGRKSVDFGLLRNHRFLSFALVPLAPAVGFVTMISYLPVALAAMFDMTTVEAGMFLLPMTIPVLVGPLLAAQLVRRVSRITPMMIVYASILSLILGDLGLLLLPAVPLGWLVIPLVLVGLGYGLTIGLIDAEAIATVPERSNGTAVGVLNFLRTGSAAVVVGVYGITMAALIGLSLPSVEAAKVTAGEFGHGDVYAASLQTVLIAMASIVALLGVIIRWLHRSADLP